MMWLLVAALADALGIISSKIALSKGKLSVSQFNIAVFILLALLTALTLPWLGAVQSTATEIKYLILFGIMVVVATVWNYLFAKSLKAERVEALETLILFIPLITALLAAVIYPDERNPQVLIGAGIASVALLWSHIHHGHLAFARSDRWAAAAILLIAVESLLIKSLLVVWSPAALYFARTAAVALLFIAFQPRIFTQLRLDQYRLVAVAAVCGVTLKLLQFTGYQQLGVVYTTMILVLAPFFTLLLDRLILKERLHPRQLFAILLLVLGIVIAVW